MDCYACDQEATRHCSRCGKPYCPAHGGDLCDECLDPVKAAPSGAVFRASVFALLAASVLALWLLIRPPSLPGEGSTIVRPQATASPEFSPSGTKPARPPSPAVSPQATPTPPSAPEATIAPEPPPPAPPPPLEYVVQEGDTWYGIAQAYGISAEDLAAVNGRTLDYLLQPGDVLVIPQ